MSPLAFPRTGFYPATESIHRDEWHAAICTSTEPADGMSFRAYVAAKVLPALFEKSPPGTAVDHICESAVLVADRLMVALNAADRRDREALSEQRRRAREAGEE